MSTDGSTGPTVDTKGEEMDKVDSSTGSKVSKESVKSEAKENLNVKSELNLQKDFPTDKKKDMPELKKKEKRMVGLPPINVNELTTILQDPAILSKDLMKEIAEKIKIRNEELESMATSINKANPLGIKSVLDCIMEVTLSHPEASSDDEEEDEHEPHVFEIPCDYCKKIFGSTMSLKTHVLMSHSQDDPSVLNVRLRSSIDDDKLCEQVSRKDEEPRNSTKVEKQNDVHVRSPRKGKGTSHSQHLDPLEINTQDNEDNQGHDPDLPDPRKTPTSQSPTALNSMSVNDPLKPSPSSLRNRIHSLESQDVTESRPDLIQAGTETAEAASSDSRPQSTSRSMIGGKRKSDNSSLSSSAKRGKRSRRSMSSGDDDAAVEQESVHLRRSSRKK